MRWVDRAVEMEKLVQYRGAPKPILRRIADSIQCFVWATDCRRQANLGACGFGAKADKAHYHGKKAFHEVKAWLDATT